MRPSNPTDLDTLFHTSRKSLIGLSRRWNTDGQISSGDWFGILGHSAPLPLLLDQLQQLPLKEQGSSLAAFGRAGIKLCNPVRHSNMPK